MNWERREGIGSRFAASQETKAQVRRGRTSNVQHSTFNILHSTSKGRGEKVIRTIRHSDGRSEKDLS